MAIGVRLDSLSLQARTATLRLMAGYINSDCRGDLNAATRSLQAWLASTDRAEEDAIISLLEDWTDSFAHIPPGQRYQ